jgi:hypothetical protein
VVAFIGRSWLISKRIKGERMWVATEAPIFAAWCKAKRSGPWALAIHLSPTTLRAFMCDRSSRQIR